MLGNDLPAKYVNPFTDYGFKKIFGEEANKLILIDLFNSLLKNESPIRDLSFKNNEQLGESFDAKGIVFDIYCENERGEKFIVELQKSKQNWFKERTIYYSTFAIREQVQKGQRDYNLKAVYCIGILDFKFEDQQNKGSSVPEWKHVMTLKNQHGEIFYDKLTYVYLEMPNFMKTESELTTRLDKWLYFIKHLEDFQSIPEIFKDEVVFIDAFEKAEIAKFNKAQLDSYEYSLKGYRDWHSIMDTAIQETEIRVRTETEIRVREETEQKMNLENHKRIIEMAKSLKNSGVDISIIVQSTGLPANEIENL